jgi:hypothetical protein
MRDDWNAAKTRVERRILLNGTDWFVWDADPAHKYDLSFHGAHLFNYFNTSEGSMYPTLVGGVSGGYGLNALGGGVELRSGMGVGDYVLLTVGSTVAGHCNIYNMSENPYLYFKVRLPNAGDLLNHYVFLGLNIAPAIQRVGLVFDTTVDMNWRFTTVFGGATSTIIAPADNNWHTFHLILSPTECSCIYDYMAAITHTTNIPVGNQTLWLQNGCPAGGAFEYLDLMQVKILQDAP